jgi:hypothetical protein
MLPIAQCSEAPSGFGLENGYEGYFQRFAGPSGAGTRLARQDLGCHLGNALILLHTLAFPEISGRRSPSCQESAIASPCDKR